MHAHPAGITRKKTPAQAPETGLTIHHRPDPKISGKTDLRTDPKTGPRTGPETGPTTDPKTDSKTGPRRDPKTGTKTYTRVTPEANQEAAWARLTSLNCMGHGGILFRRPYIWASYTLAKSLQWQIT